jgi:ribosomal protein S18 acetylase RimI-like enzyme
MSRGGVRPYVAGDEPSWLRCRAVGFLDTNYFDDVLVRKPQYSDPSVELVVALEREVIGVIDIVIDGSLATIETIATHPDHRRQGIGKALLAEPIAEIPDDVVTLDAWTREDAPANDWYRANGFAETFRYLHVYASSSEEIASSIPAPHAGLQPVRAFFHADIAEERRMRAEYARVYVCRRYERQLR